ncbi:MAG: GNAT family N-acetyltransferase [Anaerolineales bacterium]|nr:MAG: GNAT family N-acetyltransferase [Anaerolineales bacterium]
MVASVAGREKKFRGLRPMEPIRDLRQVAALIEEAFADQLDLRGQKALRELKTVSRLGPLLWLLDRLSPEFHETFSGFVWVEEGRVVGNVTVNRSNWRSRRWFISNVAVERAYQGQGIARELMQAAIGLARGRGGESVTLQVRADNVPALKLYRDLGFEALMGTTELQLEKVGQVTFVPAEGFTLRQRDYSEWRKEYELAQAATPASEQRARPIREEDFRKGFGDRIVDGLDDIFAGRRTWRLAVDEADRFVATLTVRASWLLGRHGLKMMVHPDYRGQVEEMLVTQALALLGNYLGQGVAVKMSASHQEAIETLKRYGFVEEKTLVQMRLNL